jgi:NADH:ubiquinone oxidoreductase subunit 2 (subunit N)
MSLLVLLGKKRKKNKGSVIRILVMLSGLPPFVVFFYKIQFFLVLVETVSLVSLLIIRLGYVLRFYGYFRHVFNYVFSSNKLDLKKF